ncbi:MAG: DNA adenine methylase [Caulobacteraceae bacterium]
MNTVLKYPGSKWSTANWIISHFPVGYEKMTYLEPYGGSLAVFFNKKRSVIETVNDLDSNVVNLFRVIREHPEELAQLVKFTPWAREEYKNSYEQTDEAVEKARRFLVRMWMAIGSKSSDITGFRNVIKDVSGNIPHWNNRLPDRILEAAERLQHTDTCVVQIECQPALQLIERYNRENVLMYIDPPYLLSTRSKRIYKHEMNDNDHLELLETLKNHKAKVILSGYENDMYNSTLRGWHKESKNCLKEAGLSATEVLWMNYEPPIEQLRMSI